MFHHRRRQRGRCLDQGQKIGIDGEAYFIAMGDTFQIWKPETFDSHDSEVDALLDDLGGADIWTLLESEEEV